MSYEAQCLLLGDALLKGEMLGGTVHICVWDFIGVRAMRVGMLKYVTSFHFCG